MSKAKLLGIRETQGEFQGKPFHSMKFHIAEPFSADKSWGQETSIQSVRYDRLPFILGRPMGFQELSTFVNTDIDITYDKNGSVIGIQFLSDDSPTKK